MSENDYLSIRAASKRLKISPMRIRAAIRAGEVPAFKVGDRLTRISWADLERWVRSHRIAPAPDHVRAQARSIVDQIEKREARS